MSTLLLFLPPRSRLRAPGQASPAPADVHEYRYALTPDGHQITAEGRAAAAALPTADSVVAVAAESDIAWRQVELPRAGRQMRAALAGKLEESLLDEPDALHFALEPEAAGGSSAWVAVTSRPWLAGQIAHLEAAQVFIDRVLPSSTPGAGASGHFFEASVADGESEIALQWSHADGVATLPLHGGLARQLLTQERTADAQWTATPGASVAAERWLGAPVALQTPAQRAVASLGSAWNLRQFDLAPHARGLRALRLAGRTLTGRSWRPVLWGLAALAAVQLIGLNLWAWRQNSELRHKREAITATLTTTFPQVRAVLDAPVQMQKQLDLLRASAGSVGEQDLESLLAAAATAWPADRPPADALAFEPGRLTLSANGWSPEQINSFRSQLLSAGWVLEASEGKLGIRHAVAAGQAGGQDR